MAGVQVDETAAGVAAVALAGHGQLRALRQRQCVDLGHVGAGTQVGKAVAAIDVGDRKAAVFQVDAHARHARLVLFAQAVAVAVGIHLADQVALLAEHARRHAHLGGSGDAGEHQWRGTGGKGAVDAVALQGAGADAQAVAQHHIA
jgi:hypothetical protein